MGIQKTPKIKYRIIQEAIQQGNNLLKIPIRILQLDRIRAGTKSQRRNRFERLRADSRSISI